MSEDGSKHRDGSDHKEEGTGLNNKEQDKCWKAFSVFYKEDFGYINTNELKIVLEMTGDKANGEKIY
jgi:Ca2+-binding EF-hand superfamily protein